MRLHATLLAAVLLIAAPVHAAEPIRVLAAGSLSTVMPRLIAASGLPADAVAKPVFGPAGTLRDRLLGGEQADLYASADTAGPDTVVAKRGGLVVPMARNRMCLLTRARFGLTADTMLDRLLDPAFRLATSTPNADPGGDYARALFRRAEALRPGADAALVAKSAMLLGGPDSMQPIDGKSPGASIFIADRADGLIYYCSGADAAVREVDGLVSIPVPPALEVGPVYGLAVLTDRPEAARLALFIVSQHGQAILKEAGLLQVLQ